MPRVIQDNYVQRLRPPLHESCTVTGAQPGFFRRYAQFSISPLHPPPKKKIKVIFDSRVFYCSGFRNRQLSDGSYTLTSLMRGKVKALNIIVLNYDWYYILFDKLRSAFYAFFLLLINYFDDVMTKFIVSNWTDALKTNVKLLFIITNCRTVRSRSLTCRINYNFICLFAY